MNEPTHLDLFSGIGGFALAAKWAGFKTIGFCEIDGYCQKVLAKNFGAVLADSSSARSSRAGSESQSESLQQQFGDSDPKIMADTTGIRSQQATNGCEQGQPMSELGSAPIFSNIFKLDGRDFLGADLITGGFPCQPFSCAGKRRGKEDDRYLWPEMLRIIAEARPAWVLAENVAGIVNMELDRVLSDLGSEGYAVGTLLVPACAVDARHRRMRVWIVAFDMCRRFKGGRTKPAQFNSWESGQESLAYSQGNAERSRLCQDGTGGIGWGRSSDSSGEGTIWLPEPGVGRVAHGVPDRVDRLRGLGNAIVPQVAYKILKEIRKLI